MKIRTATVYTLKVAERGRINPWMDYEIEKQKAVYDDGEVKTYYEIYIIVDYDTGMEYETVKGLTLDECIAYATEVYCSKPMTAIAILDHKFRTLCIL